MNREYLRQVIHKYICYVESKNFSKASTVQKAISDLMQFDEH